LVLSGMSAMEQVKQNVASAEQSGPGTLTAEELAVYDQVREEYNRICPTPCTDCTPPAAVPKRTNFNLYVRS
jgi:predicted aldo/keto reductase-like oxidoreductase